MIKRKELKDNKNSLSKRGLLNPAWKGGIYLVERVCQICGKDFIAVSSMINSDKYRNKGFYCSRECANKSHIKPKVGIECKQCGRLFEVIPAKEKRIFCSITCKAQWQSENPRQGTKWKDGKPIDKIHYTELSRIQHSRRRARKAKAEGHYTKEDWKLLKRKYYHRCPSCGKSEPEIVLTIDYIIPLSKGGTNWIWNIQPLCKSCNSSKMAKTVRFSKKIKGQTEII